MSKFVFYLKEFLCEANAHILEAIACLFYLSHIFAEETSSKEDLCAVWADFISIGCGIYFVQLSLFLLDLEADWKFFASVKNVGILAIFLYVTFLAEENLVGLVGLVRL